MKRKYLAVLLAVAFVIGAFGNAFATSTWYSSFASTYPSSTTLTTFGCQTCHVPAGPPNTNPYGTAYAGAGHNFKAIESLDSDGDGSTNIAEITAGTNPGDATSKPTPPPPAACTSFTYSAFSACQPNNTQTRTVLSSLPAGCTGGTPVLSQACTYVPPVTACTSFTYSAWGTCQSNNTQTRTVASSSPAGCTGGSPIVSQACTYVPPVTACTSFTYSAWGTCQSNNTQTRTVASSMPAGCTGGSPLLTQICNYVPPVNACTSFTYSAWGTCQSNNTQTRTVASSSPAGCTGGSPAVSQACTYVPPVTPPSTGTMPLPTSEETFYYKAVTEPVVSSVPGDAKPIGVGPIAAGGSSVDLKVNIGPFESPVDVSFFLYAPSIDPQELYFMAPNFDFKKLSDTVGEIERSSSSAAAVVQRGDENSSSSKKFKRLSFWRPNVTEVNEAIYKGNMLPGYYALVLVVKKSGDDDSSYSWTTHFIVPRSNSNHDSNDD